MDRRRRRSNASCRLSVQPVTRSKTKKKERRLSGHETLVVGLGERSYDVRIGEGLIGRAGEHLQPLLSSPRVLIVTDTAVRDLHLPTLQRALDTAGIRHQSFVVPAGEASKSFGPFSTLDRKSTRL